MKLDSCEPVRLCERYEQSFFMDVAVNQQSTSEITRVDGIFVPSHRRRSVALDRIEEIASLSEIVCLLPTRSAAQVIENRNKFPENVRIVPETLIREAQQRFLLKPSSHNPSQFVTSAYDLPLKRNLALELARRWGLRRICLLDDDITISPAQVRAASNALSSLSPMVGFYVFDFPDVSTIDHIDRLITQTPSQTIPGGNCLFLLLDYVNGYFPYIYNDDWLYIIYNSRCAPGLALGEVTQSPHTPWGDTERVRFEEFGETLISGRVTTAPLEQMETLSESYWSEIIRLRKRYLTSLHDACVDPQLGTALRSAINELARLRAEQFVSFIANMNSERNDSVWLNDIAKLV